ncbi:PRC-barrel domain-containing protein [Pseudorhodobacter wandonensis]|uniref:PRC-barrel domain-containing protein n=1 Tax=Pseudorhodobacter wandonensis TaxID=1120568 RepID=UPI00067C0205|nr:PRC-barrel domain-containing protein [Pseudorhodobacter wandonensis]
MRKFLLSTAVVSLLATPVLAQDTMFRSEASVGAVHASDLIGARIYISDLEINANGYNGVQKDWEDIGEINDVILSRDGKVESVLVDIGGFLGIGERQAAIDMASLRFVSDDATGDDPDDWFVVMKGNRALVETAPEWPMMPRMTNGTKEMVTAPANSMTSPREGYAAVEVTDITSEALTGATVYDATDADIGEISNLVLTTDGKIEGVIVDVGGFLGMGEKPVKVDMAELQVLRRNDGGDLRVFVPMTKENLEAMPTYKN